VSAGTTGARRDLRRTQYDAFISYSRAVDGKLAPALQSALQRFAKPWYRARAKRVFRDDASLSANPGLWSSIQQALDATRYFVLLASPQAAESKWVGKELSYWLAHKPADRVLLVLTDGEIAWDDAAGDFDWASTTALPPSLAGAFPEAPRYVDVRWARTHEHLSLADPRFREAVADVASPLHGWPKDELIGEEVRQHRRTVRLVRGAVVLLAMLALGATLAAIFAAQQRNTARTERDRAEEQSRIALSRGLAGQALVRLEGRPDLSFLLALEAYGIDPTPDARSAAIEAVQRSEGMIAILRRSGLVSRAIHEVVFSPDGGTLAARADGEIVLWSIAKRSPVRILKQRSLGGIAFSPDGNILAVPDHTETRLWDLSGSRARFERLPATGDTVLAVAFSRDGKLLASGSRDGTVSVWDVVGRGRVRPRLLAPGKPVPDPEGAVISVAFSPDRRWLASGQADGSIVLWDVSTWKPAGKFSQADGEAVSAVVFPPDGESLVSVTRSGKVWLWDYRARPPKGRPLEDKGVGVGGVALSSDGEILASGDGLGGLQLWDTSTWKPVGPPLVARGPALLSVAVSPNGKIVASADRQGTIILRHADRGQPVRLQNFRGPVARGAFSPDRRVLAVAIDGTVTLWDVASRTRLGRPLRSMQEAVLDIAFSPNGKMLAAAADDGTIGLWRVTTQELLGTIHAYRGFTTSIEFSPDGRRLASTGDDVGRLPVKVWDVRTRRLSAPPLEHETGFPTAVAFSPDGRVLASGDASGVILLWDATKASLPRQLVGHAGNVLSLVFSPDGKTLASASADSTLRLWDATTGASLGQPLNNPGGFLSDLAFSRDGRTLASTGLNVDERGDLTIPEVRLWDVPTRRLLGEPLRLSDDVVAVAFRPDGNDLSAAAEDGTVMSWNSTFWTTRLADFRARFCGIVSRSLAPDEWAEFLSGQPYRRTCA
jgi:WD40 repeat protein